MALDRHPGGRIRSDARPCPRCTAYHTVHRHIRSERSAGSSNWLGSVLSLQTRTEPGPTGHSLGRAVPKRTPRPLLRSHMIDSRHRLHEIVRCLCCRSKQFVVPPDQIVAPGIVHSSDTPMRNVALGSIGWNRRLDPVRVIRSGRRLVSACRPP
jgi:hypothetical protein